MFTPSPPSAVLCVACISLSVVAHPSVRWHQLAVLRPSAESAVGGRCGQSAHPHASDAHHQRLHNPAHHHWSVAVHRPHGRLPLHHPHWAAADVQHARLLRHQQQQRRSLHPVQQLHDGRLAVTHLGPVHHQRIAGLGPAVYPAAHLLLCIQLSLAGHAGADLPAVLHTQLLLRRSSGHSAMHRWTAVQRHRTHLLLPHIALTDSTTSALIISSSHLTSSAFLCCGHLLLCVRFSPGRLLLLVLRCVVFRLLIGLSLLLLFTLLVPHLSAGLVDGPRVHCRQRRQWPQQL